jgi:EAL and modified HD-GYP domain-containing signal transduction protein
MTDIDLLGNVALQHSALIDRDHNLLAVRLAWRPRAGERAPGVAALLSTLSASPSGPSATLLLPVQDASCLEAFRRQDRPERFWIEFPAELAAEPLACEAMLDLHAAGAQLISRGRVAAASPLTSRVALCIAEEGDLRVQEGMQSLPDLDRAFAGGAAAVLGWPVQGSLCPTDQGIEQEAALQVLIDLIQHIDNEDQVDKLEALLARSPTLSFRLLGYLNSAACGLRSEMTSVRHAIMMLGFRKLRQWVALLLASAVETPRTRPLMQASVRRALLMQELSLRLGSGEGHGDMFICGVFSLLDKMMGKPMAELLRNVPLPEAVSQCLTAGGGPLKPYLDLACGIESALPFDLDAACEATATTPAEVNLAVLVALHRAGELGWA